MKDLLNYDIYIFDYEGTLSESPDRKLSIKDLLFDFDFRNLNPTKNIYDFVSSLKDKKIYVVGIIESGKEIEQKKEWLKSCYPMIREQDCMFISSDYKKSEVILEILNKYNYDKSKVIFIDDKISHVEDVKQLGIKCVLVDDLK